MVKQQNLELAHARENGHEGTRAQRFTKFLPFHFVYLRVFVTSWWKNEAWYKLAPERMATKARGHKGSRSSYHSTLCTFASLWLHGETTKSGISPRPREWPRRHEGTKVHEALAILPFVYLRAFVTSWWKNEAWYKLAPVRMATKSRLRAVALRCAGTRALRFTKFLPFHFVHLRAFVTSWWNNEAWY